MTITYEFDEDSAQKADKEASRIDTTGAYEGKFIAAYAVVSQKTGSEGINFTLETASKETVDLGIWTRKPDGSKIFGDNLLQAIMFILGVKRLVSVRGEATVWDWDARASLLKEVDTFPALMEKPIGVLLQKELYTGQTGRDSYKMQLVGAYDVATKRTMTELKEGAPKALKLAKILSKLHDVDKRKKTVEPSFSDVPDNLGALGGGGY